MNNFLADIFGDEVSLERRIAVFTTPGRHTRLFADYKELQAYATQQCASQNVYFGLGLIRGQPKGRGKLADVAGIGALWCDIDIAGPVHSKGKLPANLEEAQGILAEMPLAPSIVVASGHGLHAYWLLQEPWIFESDKERNHAASLAKGWHAKVCTIAGKHGWALENLGDVTRILRLPGTLNHNGDRPVEVQVIAANPQRRYAADDFEQFLPVEASAVDDDLVGELTLRQDAEPPALKLLDIASASPLFWETWNKRRSDLSDQSQSAYDLSLATIAAIQDWSDQEVADLVIAFRRKHNEKPAKALRDDYIRRTISKARQVASRIASPDSDVDLSRLVGRVTDGVASPAFGPRAIARFIDDVERQELQWLWPGRIPLGKLTLLAGDPGLGKSLVSLDMAARVSRGAAWPDIPLLAQPAGTVVLFSAEDDLADTIAPRLDCAGADDSKIIAVEGVEVRNADAGQPLRWCFTLEKDLPRLEEVLIEHPGVRLVVIDPISAFCGNTDTHKNAEVRSLLAPLAELAGRFHVAVVCVTHLSKTSGTKAVYRSMGSLAFAAAARAVWAVVKDRADPQRRLLLPAKLNLAEDPDGLAYRIVKGAVAWDNETVKMHADDAFAAEMAAVGSKFTGAMRKEAGQWLREQLAGGAAASKDLIEEGKEVGFSAITLRRAYKGMGGRARKSKFDGGWVWELPTEGDHEDDQVATAL